MGGFEARADSDGVLWLSGELDMATVERFAAAAEQASDGRRRFVVDLSQLTFIDSTGIREVVRVARSTAAGVVLRNPRPFVRRVFDVTGISNHDGIEIEG